MVEFPGKAEPAISDVVLAQAVAEAVGQVQGVAAVGGGPFAFAATYGPGAIVRGVAVHHRPDGLNLEVQITALYEPSLFLPKMAEWVRSAARQTAARMHAAFTTIDVAIDDVEEVSEAA